MRKFLMLSLFTITASSTIASSKLQHTEMNDWLSVDDRVMGGISQSYMQQEQEAMVFSGNLSLENNGGFASVRSLVNLEEVPDSAAVRLKVKGDGNRYQLRFRTDKGLDGVAYAVAFDTKKDQVSEISFVLDQFIPVWRGRVVNRAPELHWDDVNQIGLMIADQQQGYFRLELHKIDWINQA